MRVCLTVPAGLSRAMARVEHGLARHVPPGVSVVKTHAEADLSVLHVIGYDDALDPVVAGIRAHGGRYAVIQYCLRTTQRPSTEGWRAFWAGAETVWSYYDLPALVREDGGREIDFDFYHAPIGLDAWAFHTVPVPPCRPYSMLSSGYIGETECAYEVATATQRVGGVHFHLGPRLPGFDPVVTRCELGLSDDQLANIYRLTRYVVGLRRVEGFELPVIEGLACGARPIVFDRPHYRRWFEPWAEFVPEGSPEDVTNALERILREVDRPVSPTEAVSASAAFDWAHIAPAFWQHAGVGQQKQTEVSA